MLEALFTQKRLDCANQTFFSFLFLSVLYIGGKICCSNASPLWCKKLESEEEVHRQTLMSFHISPGSWCIWASDTGRHREKEKKERERECVAEDSTLYFPLCHSWVFFPPLSVTFYSMQGWSDSELSVHSAASDRMWLTVISLQCELVMQLFPTGNTSPPEVYCWIECRVCGFEGSCEKPQQLPLEGSGGGGHLT